MYRFRSGPSNERTWASSHRSELKAPHKLTGSRRSEHRAGIDPAETGRRYTCAVSDLRRERIGRIRVIPFGAAENVEELSADFQRHSFANAEQSAQTHALRRAPCIAVVAVVRRRGSELTGRGVGPRGWIQNEILIGINAMTIWVLNIQRLARHPVGVGAAEQKSAQTVLSRGRQNGKAAGVAVHASQSPIALNGTHPLVGSEGRDTIVETEG